jgi:hypothetical protein
MTNEKWKIFGSDDLRADTTSEYDNAPQGLLLGRVGHEPESSDSIIVGSGAYAPKYCRESQCRTLL